MGVVLPVSDDNPEWKLDGSTVQLTVTALTKVSFRNSICLRTNFLLFIANVKYLYQCLLLFLLLSWILSWMRFLLLRVAVLGVGAEEDVVG